jgi:uncharacterized protein (DUF2237 family)
MQIANRSMLHFKTIILTIVIYSLRAYSQEACPDKDNCMLEKSSNTSEPYGLNILGTKLETCSMKPLVGFYRNGYCQTDKRDLGNHSVCTTVNDEFLLFTKNQGNDLSTPNSKYSFPGLKAGDKWCLCASRWLEAKRKGILMKVDKKATHIRAFKVTREFDFKWEHRVVRCDKKILEKQLSLLRSNEALTQDLKLITTGGNDKGCELIGLDGKVKKTSSSVFELIELEKIINQMPLRKAEIDINL